ncbi:SDR family NAD(P)-dependent oxidoreductase [Oleispirillum naphthae]|uniref:SDR family NAD(P)-dependent oxidoreductase n=1 Tax=Oleispirillum naphthae TaxID=2838853 RepID=UPI0030823593
MMNLDFTGKSIVVTGGTSGIGLDIATLLAELGGKVSICARSADNVAGVVERLRARNFTVHGKAVDVADSRAMFAYADEVEAAFGGIDVWINNAAVYPQYQIVDTPEDVWESTVAINMRSVYIGARIARQKMASKGGVLINASSFAALMPSVGSGLYAATKAAVSSMTKVLAAELAPYGIRVNCYIPGLIDTPMTRPLLERNGDAMRQSIAMNRFGGGADVAHAVAFLASPYAGYVTGAALEISGGKFCVQNPMAAWAGAASPEAGD